MWSASVQAPSSDGAGRDDSTFGWNSDDERDYQDQQYSPPSPMAYYPGSRNPLVRFMADLPNLDDFDKLSLDEALRGLPVPDSCPAPPGISLQESIQEQIKALIEDVLRNPAFNAADVDTDMLKYHILTETKTKCRQL